MNQAGPAENTVQDAELPWDDHIVDRFQKEYRGGQQDIA